MTLQDYVEYIKLSLTGGVLELELGDDKLAKIVESSLIDIRRYIDTSTMITVPFAGCIDLNGFNCSSITNVYRVDGYGGETGLTDPMYAQQWVFYSNGGGSMYNLQNYLLNYAAYNTMSQIRNTISTDLDYKIDKKNNKLYINVSNSYPNRVTIEYIPNYDNVEEITSNYWIDILKRLALANTKVILGRIRSKYKQSNALWTLDGDQLLEEGNTELNELREILRQNEDKFYPVG